MTVLTAWRAWSRAASVACVLRVSVGRKLEEKRMSRNWKSECSGPLSREAALAPARCRNCCMVVTESRGTTRSSPSLLTMTAAVAPEPRSLALATPVRRLRSWRTSSAWMRWRTSAVASSDAFSTAGMR